MPPKASQASQSSQKRPRGPQCTWVAADITELIDHCRRAFDDGLYGDNGFKDVVWQPIMEQFRDRDPLKTTNACHSKFTRLKKDYKEVKWLREASGFGWDNGRHLPTAEPQVWEAIKKVFRLYNRDFVHILNPSRSIQRR